MRSELNDNRHQDSDFRRVDFPEYLDEAVEIWDEISAWWDDRIGDGNSAQDFLIEPTQDALLNLQPGERLIDIACGAGRFTRRMADKGAKVTAVDHSLSFINRARERSVGYEERIEYHVANASDSQSLLALPGIPFDAAVCTMGLMDMAVITPLAEALPKMLKPGGRFVFSVLHPVFHSDGTRTTLERGFTSEGVEERFAISVPDYLKSRAYLGIGIVGQPRPHRYFHRPVSQLLRTFFDVGFVMSAYEEPRFPDAQYSEAETPLSSVFWKEFPLVLVARLELPVKGS